MVFGNSDPNSEVQLTFDNPRHQRPEPTADLADPASPYVIHLYLQIQTT